MDCFNLGLRAEGAPVVGRTVSKTRLSWANMVVRSSAPAEAIAGVILVAGAFHATMPVSTYNRIQFNLNDLKNSISDQFFFRLPAIGLPCT